MKRTGWVVEQRVTRGPGDKDSDMPQVIAAGHAHFVWGCFNADDKRRWCGGRHASEGLAKDHAGLLAGNIRGERT